MSTFVYTHHKADTKDIFYVGIGSKTRSKAKDSRSSQWKTVESKHGRIVNIVAEFEIRKDACDMEVFLIAAWRESGADLVNLTTGGEIGHEFSQDTKLRMSISLLAACKRQETIQKKAATMATREYRQGMSESLKLARSRPEVKSKMAAYFKTPEYKEMAASRLKNVIIRSDGMKFISTIAAARHMGVSDAAIHSVLSGKTNTACGYGWSREGQCNAANKPVKKDSRLAKVIRSDGVEFDRICDAGRSINVGEAVIRYAINSGSTATGYGWKYASTRPKAGASGSLQVRREDGVIFESGLHAAKACGVSQSMISRAIYGKAKTAGGYQWTRVNPVN